MCKMFLRSDETNIEYFGLPPSTMFGGNPRIHSLEADEEHELCVRNLCIDHLSKAIFYPENEATCSWSLNPIRVLLISKQPVLRHFTHFQSNNEQTVRLELELEPLCPILASALSRNESELSSTRLLALQTGHGSPSKNCKWTGLD